MNVLEKGGNGLTGRRLATENIKRGRKVVEKPWRERVGFR